MPRNARLTLREQNRGGGPIDVGERTRFATKPRERRILLVHGYNVSRHQAEESFEEFEKKLQDVAPYLAEDCCWVFWPGDAPVPYIRVLAYYRKLKNAKACAFEFAEYLKELSQPSGEPPHVVIIGHSLGCRLILETLAIIAQQKPPDFNLKMEIILMAAAVPITLLFEGGRLREAAFQSTRRFALFSPDDSVLSNFFAIGQWFGKVFDQHSGKDETTPPLEAVGLFGLPSIGVWTNKQRAFYYDHGDYWKTPLTAHFIASWLGVANVARLIADRVVDAKPQPTERVLACVRPFPEAREIPERRM